MPYLPQRHPVVDSERKITLPWLRALMAFMSGGGGSASGGGIPGPDGEDGEDGWPGPPGPIGATGATGPTGPAGADGSGGLEGLMRAVGDGSTTAFPLPDVADALLFASVAGVVTDPLTYTLTGTDDEITFDAAPGAGDVVTVNYVTASV